MSMQTYDKYQVENDKLLQYILDKRFFNPLKNQDNALPQQSTLVELYVSSECNLKCEYCYLNKFGDELYPKEIRDHNRILTNLETLLRHFLDEGYNIPCLEIFSGEIWGSAFGDNILSIIGDYIDMGLNIESIMVPSNFTFITSDDATWLVQKQIDAFKSRGVVLMFSASIDGAIIEEKSRPYKDEAKNVLRDGSYYEKVFDFCSKNTFGFHPMVSAKTAKYWIDNHKWFINMMKKYKISYSSGIMLLEVRNDDWTQDNIDDYIKFLDYLIDELRVNFYSSDMEMARDVFRCGDNRIITNYNAIALGENCGLPTCSIARTLHIRLGDLAIVPCHRLSYDALNYGNYIVEDGKITGIKSNNVQAALRIYATNICATHHGCDACPYNFFCAKGCFGSQKESLGDAFFPCASVCELEKRKIGFLIHKYAKIGLLDKLAKISEDDPRVKKVLEEINRLKGRDSSNER